MPESPIILIIDDSNTTLMLLEYSLAQQGFQTRIAGSVKEACKIITKTRPDLVLLDLSMPQVSGYDFLTMKAELQIPEVPVIVVSAFNDKDSVSKAFDLGAVEFIAKPFTIPEVLRLIGKYLEKD